MAARTQTKAKKKKAKYYPNTDINTLVDESAHVSHFSLLLLASIAITAWALFAGLLN